MAPNPTDVIDHGPGLRFDHAPDDRQVSHVHPVNGIVISRSAAEDLVGVIDAVALRCAPQVLSGRLVALRKRLIECCTYAKTNADVSTEAAETDDLLSFDQDAAIDSKAAAQRLGISEAGVRWHCRKGRFMDTSAQTNGRWFISRDAVDQYANERRPA
jgi:hypothetical protein